MGCCRVQLQIFSWRKRKNGEMGLLKLVNLVTQTYITNITVVKSFILYSDVQKSVHFLRFVVRGVPANCFAGSPVGRRASCLSWWWSRCCLCPVVCQENYDGSCYLMQLARDFSPMSPSATGVMTNGRYELWAL